MSRGKFASLHSGMLMRAEIGNGGFYADAAGATPNVANLAASTAAAPAPGHVRQPRTDAGNVYTHRSFSPSPARRADILPPGSLAAAQGPRPQPRDAESKLEPVGAQQLIAQAHKRVRRWDEEDRQSDEQYEDYLPQDPWQSADKSALAASLALKDTRPARAVDTTPFPMAQRTQPERETAKARRKAMTLRLTQNQHKALKLASVRLDRTCQDIMATALTSYLAEMVGIDDHDT